MQACNISAPSNIKRAYAENIQWNFQRKDSLGAGELLSSFRKLFSGGRFIQIVIYNHINLKIACSCTVCNSIIIVREAKELAEMQDIARGIILCQHD